MTVSTAAHAHDSPVPCPVRRRRFGAEALKAVLLHLLKEEPRHGYELIKAIEAVR